jgi:hypothetical protein
VGISTPSRIQNTNLTQEFGLQHTTARALFGPYHRSWENSDTSTEIENTLTQEFQQELYHPFDELEVPVDIVSSEDEPEVPVDFERVDEDIERCASSMAMDLCPVASLPGVPSDGDEAMSSPNESQGLEPP